MTGPGRWQFCAEHSEQEQEIQEQVDRANNPLNVRRSQVRKHLIKVFPDLEVVRCSEIIWSRSEIIRDLQDTRACSPPLPFLLKHAFTKDGMLKEPGPGLIPAQESYEAFKTYYFLKQLGRKSKGEYTLYLYRVVDKSVLDPEQRARFEMQVKKWKRRNRWCRLDFKLELFDGREACETESTVDTIMRAGDIPAQLDTLLIKAKRRANEQLEKIGLTYPLDVTMVAELPPSKNMPDECKVFNSST